MIIQSGSKSPVVFLMGPTAAGKTAAAMHLYDKLGADNISLISVDSALVYKHMNIGTAKPTDSELHLYPHGLINIRKPYDSYCAAQFCTDAKLLIAKAHQEKKMPILVGGTMLYFKALLQGLSDLPTADLQVREKIQEKIRLDGLAAAYAWLQEVDQITAERLHFNDQQRIERALEIFLSSGKPMSAQYNINYFKKGWDVESLAQSPWHIIPVAIAPAQKSMLHPIIEQRFEDMLLKGFLDEMKSLMAMPAMSATTPSMRAVGYRQAWAHLLGETNLLEFTEQSKAATRQLAKRQMTWLRSWSSLTWVDPFEADYKEKILQLIEQFTDAQ